MEATKINNWPDTVRLKMIERSEFYGDGNRVYQYGYYDGYQYRNQQVSELLEALNYCKLILEEVSTQNCWKGEKENLVNVAANKAQSAIKKATE